MRAGRGQALVEFALVFPLFVMLLCGVLDGGRLVYAWNALSDMARTAGRAVSVQHWPAVCDGITHDPAGANTCVNAIIATQLVGVPGAVGTVSCVPSGCGPDAKMTVRVHAKMTLVTPILAQLMGSPDVTGITTFVVIG